MAAKDNENCALLDGHVDVEAFLKTARTSGKVLVHCVQGLNRSGLVVAAALVRDGADVIDAVRTLRARRGNDALSNTNFQRRLVRYAARMGRLGPVPDVVVSGGAAAAPAARGRRPRGWLLPGELSCLMCLRCCSTGPRALIRVSPHLLVLRKIPSMLVQTSTTPSGVSRICASARKTLAKQACRHDFCAARATNRAHLTGTTTVTRRRSTPTHSLAPPDHS